MHVHICTFDLRTERQTDQSVAANILPPHHKQDSLIYSHIALLSEQMHERKKEKKRCGIPTPSNIRQYRRHKYNSIVTFMNKAAHSDCTLLSPFFSIVLFPPSLRFRSFVFMGYHVSYCVSYPFRVCLLAHTSTTNNPLCIFLVRLSRPPSLPPSVLLSISLHSF